VIKLQSLKWLRYVAHMGEMRKYYEILIRKIYGKVSLGHVDIDGRIMLQLILEKHDVKLWTGVNCLSMGYNGGFNLSSK
jgi:hypothetical protein